MKNTETIQELGLEYSVKPVKDRYLTNMFAKVFSQIFDSSIAQNFQTRHVFTDLLVLADVDGTVDMTMEAISRRTNVPIEIVRSAIEELTQPDPTSRTQESEGRRIELLDSHRNWGWRIVNYEKYRELRDNESRRRYFRDQQRINRLRNKEPELSTQVDAEEEGEREVLLVEASTLSEFCDRWNKIPSLPKVRKLTHKRKSALRTRLKEPEFRDNWREAMARMAESNFCKGQNAQRWQATMDWFIKPDTVTKILEGKYDNREQAQDDKYDSFL